MRVINTPAAHARRENIIADQRYAESAELRTNAPTFAPIQFSLIGSEAHRPTPSRRPAGRFAKSPQDDSDTSDSPIEDSEDATGGNANRLLLEFAWSPKELPDSETAKGLNEFAVRAFSPLRDTIRWGACDR